MATIKTDELNELNLISDLELAEVKGGAWYAKFDGVDGSSTAKSTPKLQEAVCSGSF